MNYQEAPDLPEDMNIQMRELANQVIEFFPSHPESAFKYFRELYPDIVAGTIVNMVWGFIEYDFHSRLGIAYTRPLRRRDLMILNDPNLRN